MLLALACLLPAVLRADDVIELLSGAKVQGKLTQIKKAERLITFEATIGSKKYTRVYPYGKIHAVTWNGNPNRWREGVRLMHHLLTLHKDNPSVRARVLNSLGSMYFRFFKDYARAAFWMRQAGVDPTSPQAIKLAECYWRLGNKQMAV
jgi:hypothetical protein